MQVLGRRVVELDCAGHSMCVQFYVYDDIPFPWVSVSRLLIQDFWTVMSKDFMALMTPNHQTVPIARQGTLVHLTPTVISMIATQDPEVSWRCAVSCRNLKLRGMADLQDCEYAHLAKIADLTAVSASEHQDFWKTHEADGRLVRHI